jgi:hypothetical protein
MKTRRIDRAVLVTALAVRRQVRQYRAMANGSGQVNVRALKVLLL